MSRASAVPGASAEPARKTALASPKASVSSRPTRAGSPLYSVNRPASSAADAISLSCAGNLPVSNTSRISRPISDSLPTSATVLGFGMTLANLALRLRSRPAPPMTPHASADPNDDSAGDVRRGQGKQHQLRVIPDEINQNADHNHDQRRSRPVQVDVLEA